MQNQFEQFRAFITWAQSNGDLDLLDDTRRFLRKLYIFSSLRFGGDEYRHQQFDLQEAAEKLERSADRIKRDLVPMDLRIMATPRREDKLMLNLAKKYASIADEFLHGGVRSQPLQQSVGC